MCYKFVTQGLDSMSEKNSLYTFKWANELHWIVKGHLIPKEWADDEQQVRSVFDSYFKRL